MKLQQLRYLCAVVEHGFNITDASAALHTSQPGISKQMRLLEEELGVGILVRSGNRIVGMTEAGTAIVQAGRRALVEARQIEEIAREATHQNRGQFTVATTHLHVRYSLLPVIKTFAQKYPNVQLKLLQGAPAEIATRVSSGEADVGISTGTDDLTRQCVSLDAYPLYRCVIAPRGHPLLRRKRPTLRDLAAYPLIIYDPSFSSGSVVTGAFEAAGITPNVVLSAMDADVIKAYVGAGVGIAVCKSSPSIRPAISTSARSASTICFRRRPPS